MTQKGQVGFQERPCGRRAESMAPQDDAVLVMYFQGGHRYRQMKRLVTTVNFMSATRAQ